MKRLLFLIFIVGCTATPDRTSIAPKLTGTWVSPAWDGELHESWTLEADGWLRQQSFYIERGDTTYRAQSRIMKTTEKWVLYTIIEDSNPKIFQADEMIGDSIVFYNSEYGYPNQVTYRFIDLENYERTISGNEDGEPISATFYFKKQ